MSGARVIVALAVACLGAWTGIAKAAEPGRKALIAVVKTESGDPDEDALIDRLEAVMIGKAARQARYDTVTILDGAEAREDNLLRVLGKKFSEGYAVDLVNLARGMEVSQENLQSLLDHAAPGRLNFAYALPERETAPFHFARFISELGRGASPADAVAAADGVSRSVSERLADYAEPRETYRHTALEEGLIKWLGRLVAPHAELAPERVESLSAMVDGVGPLAFSAVQGAFPGRDQTQVQLPGVDVRVILGRVIPDFEKYIQNLVDHLDSLEVKQGKGRLIVDALFEGKGMRLDLHKKAEVKTGRLYAVDISHRVHFEISMRKDSITIDRISGADVRIKLPLIKGAVAPQSLSLDTEQEKLTVTASALGGLVKVVGTADVRAKKFTGVDWLATVFKNWPLLLGALLFV